MIAEIIQIGSSLQDFKHEGRNKEFAKIDKSKFDENNTIEIIHNEIVYVVYFDAVYELQDICNFKGEFDFYISGLRSFDILSISRMTNDLEYTYKRMDVMLYDELSKLAENEWEKSSYFPDVEEVEEMNSKSDEF